MVRRHLSESLKEAGQKLLAATDALDMRAQGAMWIYSKSLEDWRYYLVTSLVDTIGRRKTYRLLLEVFERLRLPKEITIEDVHLGSPNDQIFHLISQVVHVDGGGRAEFQNCLFNDVLFDGIVYRSVKSLPSLKEAAGIDKRFQMKVKKLLALQQA